MNFMTSDLFEGITSFPPSVQFSFHYRPKAKFCITPAAISLSLFLHHITRGLTDDTCFCCQFFRRYKMYDSSIKRGNPGCSDCLDRICDVDDNQVFDSKKINRKEQKGRPLQGKGQEIPVTRWMKKVSKAHRYCC